MTVVCFVAYWYWYYAVVTIDELYHTISVLFVVYVLRLYLDMSDEGFVRFVEPLVVF